MVTRPLRVVAWPIGDASVASSRLRLFEPLRRMSDVQAQILAPTADRARERLIEERRQLADLVGSADLVYVQKDARSEAMALASAAREARVPVVYDLDDDLGCWPGMSEAELIASAQLVVVDSPERARTLPGVPTISIPCMIDLPDDPARRVVRSVRGAPVGSFGNRSSLLGSASWLQAAVRPDRRVRVVGPADLELAVPCIEVVTFDIGTFVSDVMSMDAVILAHHEGESARKDENRLVMALSCARPTLVGPTPSYVALVAAFDAEHLVVATPADVADALERLRDPGFARVEAGHEHVWTRYHPDRIAAELRGVFAEAAERAEV